jgi:ABC-2 type transport system ATP-binding protein
VLHKGRVLAHGALDDIVGQAGAGDLGGAFNRLTAAADRRELDSAA